MIVLAIDIGLTGAVATLDHAGRFNLGDIPTLEAEDAGKSAKRRIDGHGLGQLIRHYVPAEESALVLIEDVQARPIGRSGGVERGNSMQSQGSLMRSRGIVEGVLDMLRLPVRVVQPQSWKRHHGLLRTEKDAARVLAIQRFPSAADHLARKKDGNRADALLIAEYGQRVLA